ncbi:MAG: SPASM domain-containing protein [Acidimicrobiia bacterium]
MYPAGRFGSCDELPWPAAGLGALEDLGDEAGVVAAQGRSRMLLDGRALMVKCLACDYREVCGGGCVATRWRAVQAVGDDDAYCDYRMRLVDGIAALATAEASPSTSFSLRSPPPNLSSSRSRPPPTLKKRGTP